MGADVCWQDLDESELAFTPFSLWRSANRALRSAALSCISYMGKALLQLGKQCAESGVPGSPGVECAV